MNCTWLSNGNLIETSNKCLNLKGAFGSDLFVCE